MASSAHRLGPNLRNVIIKAAALRLSDVASGSTTDYAEIIVGDGVPSGGYGRDSGATIIYLRKDAPAANTCIYVSQNGGTNWEAVDADLSLYALLSDLASTANAKGASLIGIEDAGTIYTATNVEAALAEVKALADAAAVSATLASTANGDGASLIGLEDTGLWYTGTTLEVALAEVAVAVGGADSTHRNYSSNRAVADNDGVVTAIGKLDAFAAQTGASTGGTSVTIFRTGSIMTPAAASPAAVHNNVDASWANDFPGPFTSPAAPRSLTVTFSGAWDGGNVTIVGTDQFDQAVTETVTAAPGSTVAAVKIYKTVTSASKTAAGTAGQTASIGTGNKLGVLYQMTAPLGVCTIAGTQEICTWDAPVSGFTPSNVPNGARSYFYGIPVTETHAHTQV